MKDFHDKYLENRLKNWVCQIRPAQNARERLLRAAAVTPQQTFPEEVWNQDFNEYHRPEWTRFFTSWMIVDAHNIGLNVSRLMA